jgi:hypothetical protein
MSDEGIPTEGQAAPEPHDWEKDYKALQAEYTRSQQTLKEHEGLWEDDEALAARLREARPQWFEEDEEETPLQEQTDDSEPVSPPPDPRVDWLAEREAKRQYAEDLSEVIGEREVIGKKANDWIEARSRHIAAAANKPWDKKALAQAVDDYFEFVEDVRGPVRRPAPSPPQPGSAGTKKRDPRNREERRAAMAAAMIAQQQ